jgi:hypothetical protein
VSELLVAELRSSLTEIEEHDGVRDEKLEAGEDALALVLVFLRRC